MGLGGGILGAIIGGICGGTWGALIGGSIGACCFNGGNPKKNPAGAKSAGGNAAGRAVPGEVITLFFRCLGKLAKADGRVSEEEAAFIREFMKSLEFSKEDCRKFAAEFNAGRDSSLSFGVLVALLAQELANSGAAGNIRKAIIQTFCALVVMDHCISPEEKTMLLEAGKALSEEESVRLFFLEHSCEESSAGSASLTACYELLEIPATASDAEVKKAYRRKAMEFHPDRVQGAGLSAAFIEFAKKQFQQINSAYETICRARGLK